MEGRLNNKVALVTGGGTGLGAAFAKRFVAEGAKVVITGRRKEMLEKVAAGLPKDSIMVLTGDVSRLEDARAMVDAAIKFGGKIDVLVNNAGIDPAGTVTELPPEQWQKVIDINLTGPFLMMKAAVPNMIENGGGSIINIASLAALRCIPAMPAYIASKAGLIGLSQATALDYGKFNIRCNVICPGAVATEMLKNSMQGLAKAINTDTEGALKALTKFCPLPRAAEPDEISGAAAYLASDESSFMTGAVMVLDGEPAWSTPTARRCQAAGPIGADLICSLVKQ